MYELQWWVVILFMLVAFDRIGSLLARFSRWADSRGNGKALPVTVAKLRETLGLKATGEKTFLEAAQETHQPRFEALIGSVNALTQVNGNLLEQIKQLVALEQARIELRK